MERLRGKSPVAGAIAVVLCASMQVGYTLHHVLIAHKRCAEHGEWAHAQSTHVRTAEPTGASTPCVSASTQAELRHEHCPAASHERVALGPAQGPGCTAGAAQVQVGPSPRARPAVVTLADAPKTSPPA